MARPFQTLVELLNHAREDFPERELFGTKGSDGSWTWMHVREFCSLVEHARGGLSALGVERGDRVAIVSDNRVEWAVLAFATFTLGACSVPMYESQEPKEWRFILEDCGAKVVFAATDAVSEQLQGFAAALPSLRHVVGLSLPPEDEQGYLALLARGRAHPQPSADVTANDLAAFIYTSGTTGTPKGVKLTHGNLSSNTLAAASRFSFTLEDRSLAFLPWAHAFGLVAELCTFLFVGASMAINDEVPQLIHNLPVVRPTVLVAVPRIFNRIYDSVNKQMARRPAPVRRLFQAGLAAATRRNQGHQLSVTDRITLNLADRLIFSKVRLKFGGKLRFVVSGSAALSPQVAEFIDALGIDVFEGYGLTETSPVVSVNYPGHRRIGSVGKPLDDVTVRIDKEVTGDPVSGEIVVSGPNVMAGYHNRPEEDAKVFCKDGAFRTGDMGYLDEDGYLFITGRIKEQYKLENGKYVVPSPLEEELKLSPLIANVMLYGANRPHNVALVVPDLAALNEILGKTVSSGHDLDSDPRIMSLLQAELDKYSAGFKGYERPQALSIASQDFTTENGMLTPSLKLKRRNVLSKYQAQLEALY